jgi:hypothetical protein
MEFFHEININQPTMNWGSPFMETPLWAAGMGDEKRDEKWNELTHKKNGTVLILFGIIDDHQYLCIIGRSEYLLHCLPLHQTWQW